MASKIQPTRELFSTSAQQVGKKRKYEGLLECLRTNYFLAPDGSNKEEMFSLLRGAVDIAMDTALRFYILNPFMNKENAAQLVEQLAKAKSEFDLENMTIEPGKPEYSVNPKTKGIACG